MKRISALVLSAMLIICVFTGGTGFAVANSTDNTASSSLEARLLHMLALNYNFDDDFKSDAAIFENSMIALCDLADDDGFIEKSVVLGFIENMYGYSVIESELEFSADLPQKEGCFFVIPRGYTAYTYEINSLEQYGGLVVASCTVTANPHDGEQFSFDITVDFVENSNSSFGYNIASCATANEFEGFKI